MSAEWQFIVSLNEQLRPLQNPAEVQAAAIRLIGQHLAASRVSYSYVDGDEFVISRSYTDGVQPITGRGRLTQIGVAIVEAYRRGETVVVTDVHAERRLTEFEQAHWVERQTAALVGVPLIKDGRWLATFNVHSTTPRCWTPDQIALIEMTAQRTWAMGEHARVEDALSRGKSRQAFLRQLSDTVRPLSDPARILEEACRLLGTHLRANRAIYGEIDGDECVVLGGYADGVPPLPRRFPWRQLAGSQVADILEGRTLTSNDTSTDGHTAEEIPLLQAAGIGAHICPPLVKDGRFVAAFGIHSLLPRVWTREEIELAEDVADRIWATLEYRRAEAELRANEERLAFLLRLNDAIRPLQDPAAVQETAARLLAEHLGVARAGYAEIDGQGSVVRSQYARGVAPLPTRGPSLTFGAALHDAYLRGEMVVVDDVASDPRLTDVERAIMADRQMSAYVTVRVIKGGRAAAAFGVSHPTPRMWTPVDIALVRDVAERTWEATERARAEAALLEQEAQLHRALAARREEEHHRELRLLLETATQGIVSINAEGVIVTANRAFAQMFGWLPAELIGQPIDRLVPAAFRESHHLHRTAYFAAPRPRLMAGLVGERRDGTTFPLEVSLNHVPSSGGGLAFAFITDITERVRAAVALQQRTAELEDRTKQLSQMAWDLTLAEHHAREQIARTLHDGLQQLLVIVSLNLDVQLKRDSEAGGVPNAELMDAKRHLEEAIAAARSLSRELFPPVLHRSGLPAALAWLATWTHEKYRLEVEVVADSLADSSRSDLRTLLYESARELLFNAVKHAKTDRVRLELTLDDDDHLSVTVTDQGVGFDPDSLDDRWKTGQAGWGLFSIRERLTLLGGRFDVESAIGRGTRVRLTAPRGARAGAGASAASAEPVVPLWTLDVTRASQDRLRILIVDDHAAVRNALRKMLNERPQMRVVGEATDGIDAIVHARRLRPDVILMDVVMPHMDGIEATERIRAEFPDIQILGLSMQARSETVHAIEHAGADGYFVKGLDTQRLLDRLQLVHASRAGTA